VYRNINNKTKFKQEFKELTKQDKMPISSVEDLMQKNIEEYKSELLRCTEEMLLENIDEKDLISKKKDLWNNKGIRLKNIGKRKLEFTLITGKITFYRTVLQICDDINLDDYNLSSKYIVPLDEYLCIDNLPFKISIKTMIAIAFWGQNQSSFEKATKIIQEIYDINISTDMTKKVTEYIGNLLFQNLMNNANEVWNNRANLDINSKKDKLILLVRKIN